MPFFFPSQAPPLFLLFFLLVLGLILCSVGRLLFQTVENLNSPILARPARVMGKRQHTHVHGGQGDFPASSTTTYYVTFEFPDGSREEFRVSPADYGLLAERDEGTLHSQGTWFQGFDRQAARGEP